MALRSLMGQSNPVHFSSPFLCFVKPSIHSSKMQYKVSVSAISRRMGMAANIAVPVVLMAGGEAISDTKDAKGLDLRFVAPDQTIQEAESGVRGHAQTLLEIKSLIESESWGAAQKALRQSSSLLKQDMYTIIQNKPGSERSLLRKLYSNLFNNVSKLDYAARDKDASRVRQCYDNIVVAVKDILSRI